MNTQPILNSKKEKAVAYLRVSTQKQQKEGNSLEVQNDLANRYAGDNSLEIVKTFKEAKSAYKSSFNYVDAEEGLCHKLNNLKNRSVLEELIAYITKEKIKHLIVYSKDRLSRNLEISLALDVFFTKQNIRVHYTKTGENIESKSDAINKFLKLVFASVSELESNLISQRVKDGLKAKVNRGCWPGGKPPFGYKKYDKDNKSLPKNADELEKVQKIFNLYTNYGFNYQQIAYEMNRLYPYECSDIKWNTSTIRRILNNEIYSGYIVWNKRNRTDYDSDDIIRVKSNQHLSTIDRIQWDISSRISKNKQKDSKYYSTPFLLKNKLICKKCNTLMKPINYGTDRHGRKRVDVYKCSSKNDCKFIVKQPYIEHAVLNKILNTSSILSVNSLWNLYCNSVNEQQAHYNNALNEVNETLDSLKKTQQKTKYLISTTEDEIIKEALEYEYININHEIKAHEYREGDLTKKLSKSAKSKLDLKKSLNVFFNNGFNDLSMKMKRIVIDILIDKVTVSKVDNKLDINIVMNTKI
ncbi:recombinase family protein [Tepidibacter sp. Z1-5]|uniref:recombinase family protein n=1 Tax=Tepidibacter sp. Z1-5 TaxID=3134138 RepID=UPI0030C3D87E